MGFMLKAETVPGCKVTGTTRKHHSNLTSTRIKLQKLVSRLFSEKCQNTFLSYSLAFLYKNVHPLKQTVMSCFVIYSDSDHDYLPGQAASGVTFTDSSFKYTNTPYYSLDIMMTVAIVCGVFTVNRSFPHVTHLISH